MKRIITLVLVFCIGTTAFGWGLTGHRIVGHIAMEHLDKKVRTHIIDVLGGEDLAMVANWIIVPYLQWMTWTATSILSKEMFGWP